MREHATMNVLEMHQRAQSEFARVLQHVTDADLDAPTPCDEWTVADLIGHAIDGNRTVAELLGASPEPVPAGTAAERYSFAASQAQDALAREGALAQTVTLPFGEIPVAAYVGIRSGDLYAHAWDLATSIGADTDLDPELGAAVWAATEPILSPALRGEGRPFGEEQPCGPEHSVADRYAALLGRAVE